jgi:hypothetical protein
MDDVTQIRVGGQTVGQVGLQAALADAADPCREMAAEALAEATEADYWVEKWGRT